MLGVVPSIFFSMARIPIFHQQPSKDSTAPEHGPLCLQTFGKQLWSSGDLSFVRRKPLQPRMQNGCKMDAQRAKKKRKGLRFPFKESFSFQSLPSLGDKVIRWDYLVLLGPGSTTCSSDLVAVKTSHRAGLC